MDSTNSSDWIDGQHRLDGVEYRAKYVILLMDGEEVPFLISHLEPRGWDSLTGRLHTSCYGAELVSAGEVRWQDGLFWKVECQGGAQVWATQSRSRRRTVKCRVAEDTTLFEKLLREPLRYVVLDATARFGYPETHTLLVSPLDSHSIGVLMAGYRPRDVARSAGFVDFGHKTRSRAQCYGEVIIEEELVFKNHPQGYRPRKVQSRGLEDLGGIYNSHR